MSQQPAHFFRAWRLTVPFMIWLFASGCPENAALDAGEQPAKCSQIGQRCEYSPGKLGTCVLRDDCRGNDCFVCQSQH